jgi:isopentenyl-diphosphate delta-isomerase
MTRALPDTAPHSKHDIILVDAFDRPAGTGLKLPVHREGRLHRAFSIFLVRSDGSWLLQQRAATKYHSPLLWANACCGHPRPGETVVAGAIRRLSEELGICVELKQVGTLVYRATLDHDLVEHEYDHLLAGAFDGACFPAPDEVAAVRWVTLTDLRAEVDASPERFTAWLRATLRGEARGVDVEHLLFDERLVDRIA